MGTRAALKKAMEKENRIEGASKEKTPQKPTPKKMSGIKKKKAYERPLILIIQGQVKGF